MIEAEHLEEDGAQQAMDGAQQARDGAQQAMDGAQQARDGAQQNWWQRIREGTLFFFLDPLRGMQGVFAIIGSLLILVALIEPDLPSGFPIAGGSLLTIAAILEFILRWCY